MTNTSQNPRDENLQILRFVAAALVLITHITFYIHERIDLTFEIWHGGEVGVPIFFVISGYVMYFSGAKLPKNATGALCFLRKRIARIFPLCWLINSLKLAIAVVAPATILHNYPNLPRILCSYLLIPMQNDAGELQLLHGVAWTLLHEMLFYYVFSVALLLNKSPAIFSSAVILALWLIGLFVPADSAIAHVCFSQINLMFVIGMCVAALRKQGYKLPPVIATMLLLMGIAIIANPTIGTLRRIYFGDFPVEVIFIFAGFISLDILLLSKLKSMLVKLGDSSYSLYMIHPIVAPAAIVILYKIQIQSSLLVMIIAFIISTTIANYVYRFIEHPLNARVGKFLEKLTTRTSASEIPSKEFH